MRWRRGVNDFLMGWKFSGGARESLADMIQRGSRNRMVVTGMTIVLIMVILALLAPVLPIADPTPEELHPEDQTLAPHWWRWFGYNVSKGDGHWFGTDELGRDVFSRAIWGARVSLLVATLAVCFSLIIGVLLGLTAGYFGGKVDYLIAGTIDLFWTFPSFLLALAFAAALGPSLTNVILAISISYWAGFARLMRGQALSVRERLFVEASRALGARNIRIMFTHVLPNCIAPLIVWASIGVADAITIESSLSFLGVGTQPPTPSWGYMLYRGIPYLEEAPWIATFPGIILLITILGFNLLGDGMRDVLDPRMKGMRR
jgi:peptide/nickel transport system permease protein